MCSKRIQAWNEFPVSFGCILHHELNTSSEENIYLHYIAGSIVQGKLDSQRTIVLPRRKTYIS